VRELPAGKETHFGDEERIDLSEVATIATLEIAPSHASDDGWLLGVVAVRYTRAGFICDVTHSMSLLC